MAESCKLVKIEEALHQKAKEVAVKKKISLQEFVDGAIRTALRPVKTDAKCKEA